MERCSANDRKITFRYRDESRQQRMFYKEMQEILLAQAQITAVIAAEHGPRCRGKKCLGSPWLPRPCELHHEVICPFGELEHGGRRKRMPLRHWGLEWLQYAPADIILLSVPGRKRRQRGKSSRTRADRWTRCLKETRMKRRRETLTNSEV